MPRPRPSLVAREDVAASVEEDVSGADAPSGKVGMTVGTESDVLADDEEEEEWVREDAIIDIVVVIGVSVDNVLGIVVVSGSEVITESEDSSELLVIVSDQAPLHVGGVTGVMTGINTEDELVLTHVL